MRKVLAGLVFILTLAGSFGIAQSQNSYAAANCNSGTYSDGYIIASCYTKGDVQFRMICNPLIGADYTRYSEKRYLSAAASVKLVINRCDTGSSVRGVYQVL